MPNYESEGQLIELTEDYVWLNPDTGETTCWLNNLPNPWSPAGTNNSIIASGAGRAISVYLAVSSVFDCIYIGVD
jgi:hypothetical protein